MNNIVSVEWLAENLNNENIIIIDCRFSLANKDHGRALYEKSHLKNAHYFDLEKDLSGPVKEKGGRHPLPDIETFKRKLEQIGVSNDSTVIVYDQGVGAFAARCWFLLSYIGHEKTFILNGGYAHWLAEGYDVTDELPQSKEGKISLNINSDLVATYEDVQQATRTNNVVLIDSREEDRFKGISEPIDKIPGRIPGSINKVWHNVIKDGFFLTDQFYKKYFNDINKTDQVIIYCGSGVTAIPNYIAMKKARFTNLQVYIGSYSDWISYENSKIAKD